MKGIFLYIDPGTGAMLFTTILGLVTTLSFALKKWFIKMKFNVSSRGSKEDTIGKAKLDYVIFSDDKRYWNTFKSICDEFERRKLECHYYTASEDDPALTEKYEYVKCKFIGNGNKAYARLNMLSASICLATTPGLDVYQWKRSKSTEYYVHLVHEVGGLVHYRMFGIDYFDAVLIAGSAAISEVRELEQIRNLPTKELVVVGSTYMDSLLKKHNDYMSYNSKAAYKNDRRSSLIKVLVAPTWGKESLLNRFGNELLSALYSSNYDVMIRPHPQSYVSERELLDELQEKFPEKNNWHWNRDNDNYAALENSDVLISDFSGIIYDYALVFDKPVIFVDTEMDNSIYDACWIKHSTLRDVIQPKLGISISREQISDICKIIDNSLIDARYNEDRACVRNMCWENVGKSAESIVDWLVKKRHELAQ